MKIETLAWGYTLPEAVRVDEAGYLYFSDALGLGGVYRRSPGGEIETLVPGRKLVGGLVLHRDGGFVMSGPEVQYWKDGLTRTLLELEGVHYFCDMHADRNGAVYVSSIRADIEKLMAEVDNRGKASPRDQMRALMEPGECYRINLDGSVDQLYDEVLLGNGLGFSGNGDTLYHVDSFNQGIVVHDVDSQGRLSNRRLVAQGSFTYGGPDGMCVDDQGNLLVAHVGGGRIVRLSPDGEELSEISLPAKEVVTLAFGGSKLDQLYVCTADNLEDPARRGTVLRISDSGLRGGPAPLAAV